MQEADSARCSKVISIGELDGLPALEIGEPRMGTINRETDYTTLEIEYVFAEGEPPGREMRSKRKPQRATRTVFTSIGGAAPGRRQGNMVAFDQ